MNGAKTTTRGVRSCCREKSLRQRCLAAGSDGSVWATGTAGGSKLCLPHLLDLEKKRSKVPPAESTPTSSVNEEPRTRGPCRVERYFSAVAPLQSLFLKFRVKAIPVFARGSPLPGSPQLLSCIRLFIRELLKIALRARLSGRPNGGHVTKILLRYRKKVLTTGSSVPVT